MRRSFLFIFWGFFSLFFHVNIGSISLLPPFAGYLLIAYGASQFPGQAYGFDRAKWLGVGMAVFSLLLRLTGMESLSGSSYWLSPIALTISLFLQLLLFYQVISGASCFLRSKGVAGRAAFLEKTLCIVILLQTAGIMLESVGLLFTDADTILLYVMIFLLLLSLFNLFLLRYCWQAGKRLEQPPETPVPPLHAGDLYY